MKRYIIPVMLLFFAFHLGAQRVSFDLSLMTEIAQNEYFYGDPHYDESGDVVYYSMGDDLRIYNIYDEARRIVRKDFYSFNDFHYEWILVQSVVYTLEDGGLKEETVYSIPSRDDNSLSTPEMNKTFVRQFAYDPERRTVTVTAYSTASAEKGKTIEKDTTTVIRYLNDNGLVYKAYTREKSMNHREGNMYEFYSMQLYTYDDDLLLVKMEKYFYKTHLPEWTLSEVSQIERVDNQVLFSFYDAPQAIKVKVTADDPFSLLDRHRQYLKEKKERKPLPDGEEKIPFLVVIPENIIVEPDRLIYAFSMDRKGRLTARDVAVNGVTFDKSSYNYDEQGRTSLIQESSGMNKAVILASYPDRYFVEYDLERINVPFQYKFTAVYTGEDCLNIIFRQRTGGDEFMIRKEKEYCYADERLFSSVASKEYTERGSIYEEKRVEFNYAEDGQSGEYIEYRQEDELDNSSGVSRYVRRERPSARMLFRLDGENGRINQEKYYYDKASEEWKLYEGER